MARHQSALPSCYWVDQRPDDFSPPRTDNIIVLTVEPGSGNVGMVSVPRDMFVSLPGFDYSGRSIPPIPSASSKYPGGGGAGQENRQRTDRLSHRLLCEGQLRRLRQDHRSDRQHRRRCSPRPLPTTEYPTIDYGVGRFTSRPARSTWTARQPEVCANPPCRRRFSARQAATASSAGRQGQTG